jgi:hypothetical protein
MSRVHLLLLGLLRRDRLLVRLALAPYDDEPVTPEEEAAVQAARREIGCGEGVPWEQVRAELLDEDAESAAFWDTHSTMDYAGVEVDPETLRPLDGEPR